MPFDLTPGLLLRLFVLPPAGLCWLALAGWLLRARWPRLGLGLMLAALALLLLLSTTAGARLLVRPLEGMSQALHDPSQTQAQAIVVLAAGRLEPAPEYGGVGIPDYVALGRLRYGAHLQRQTGLPLLVSGGNRVLEGAQRSKADDMARALREDFGVPVRWVEGDSEDTAQNAACSAHMLRQDGVERILLVTDAMHMGRAQRAFERSGLTVRAAPTLFFSHTALRLTSYFPYPEGMRQSYYAMHEWLGLAWYAWRDAGQATACPGATALAEAAS